MAPKWILPPLRIPATTVKANSSLSTSSVPGMCRLLFVLYFISQITTVFSLQLRELRIRGVMSLNSSSSSTIDDSHNRH